MTGYFKQCDKAEVSTSLVYYQTFTVYSAHQTFNRFNLAVFLIFFVIFNVQLKENIEQNNHGYHHFITRTSLGI